MGCEGAAGSCGSSLGGSGGGHWGSLRVSGGAGEPAGAVQGHWGGERLEG